MKKKNIILIVLLTIILMALALTVGYLVGTGKLDKSNKIDNNTKEEVQKEYSIKDANELINKYQGLLDYVFNEVRNPETIANNGYIDINQNYKGLFTLDSLNLYSNGYNSYDGLNSNYNKSTCKKLEMVDCDDDAEMIYVSYDEVNRKYKELFGKNKELIRDNFALRAVKKYVYSSKLDAFVAGNFNEHAGGRTIDPLIGKAKDAKIDSDELIINYQYFYVYLMNPFEEAYYGTEKGTKILLEEMKDKESLFEKYNAQEKVYNLKITFIKEDNHYIIKDIYKTEV